MKEFDLTTALQVVAIAVAIAAVYVFHGDILPWIMSRWFGSAGAAESTNAPVHVPVQPNQYAPGGTENKGRHDNLHSADTDAAEAGTDWQPRLPRYPTEEELVIYLATIRDAGGKYLRSANKIAEFSTLHRNDVLKLVREVRDGVPEYPAPLTPAQRAIREELRLG